MDFAAAVLTILSGLFYVAGNHELGSIGSDRLVLPKPALRAGRRHCCRALGCLVSVR